MILSAIEEIQNQLEALGVVREKIEFGEKSEAEIGEIFDSIKNQLEARVEFLSRASERELKAMNLAHWRERFDSVTTRRDLSRSSDDIVALYADGGLLSRNPSNVGGTWAWCAVNPLNERIVERSGVVPATASRMITNNHTEQIALTLALEAMAEGWSGTVYSDSRIALGRVFKNYDEKNLPANIAARSKAAVRRLGRIETVLLQGHPTKDDLARGIGAKRNLPVSVHNKWCDDACNLAKAEFFENLGVSK